MLDKKEFEEIDRNKREFMKKFGKYAATAPLGMYLLMGPGSSRAQASGSAAQPPSYGNEEEEFDYDAARPGVGITTNPLRVYKPVRGKIKSWSK